MGVAKADGTARCNSSRLRSAPFPSRPWVWAAGGVSGVNSVVDCSNNMHLHFGVMAPSAMAVSRLDFDLSAL